MLARSIGDGVSILPPGFSEVTLGRLDMFNSAGETVPMFILRLRFP